MPANCWRMSIASINWNPVDGNPVCIRSTSNGCANRLVSDTRSSSNDDRFSPYNPKIRTDVTVITPFRYQSICLGPPVNWSLQHNSSAERSVATPLFVRSYSAVWCLFWMAFSVNGFWANAGQRLNFLVDI